MMLLQRLYHTLKGRSKVKNSRVVSLFLDAQVYKHCKWLALFGARLGTNFTHDGCAKSFTVITFPATVIPKAKIYSFLFPIHP